MAYNPQNSNGQTTAANSQPVVIASDQIPAAAALSDSAANSTTTTIGAANLVWNGTTWNRLEDASVFDTSANNNLFGALAVKNVPFKTSAGLAAALNSVSTINTNGSSNITLAFNGTTTGTVVIEGTADLANWGLVECYDIFADLWVSGQSITPTTGKVYSILSGGMRQVRVRVNSALNTTATHFWTADNTQEFIAGIDTGAAPHNFGYTLVHKDAVYSTQQTTTALWTPTTGKKFAVTDITITTGGTTAGIVTIYDAASATAYTAGTTPAVFRGEFAPSTTSRPGVAKSFNVPYVSTTANNILFVTTSAAINPIYIQVNGYEI